MGHIRQEDGVGKSISCLPDNSIWMMKWDSRLGMLRADLLLVLAFTLFCLGNLHISKPCRWNKWYQSCSKAETSRHTWLLFFLLIPYHEVLSFTWKCTLSLSFSHFSISCLCFFVQATIGMISPWPIVRCSEQVPFSIFYISCGDLLKMQIHSYHYHS